MTNEDTIKIKMQREQFEHEVRVHLIDAFAKDPELKYFVGAAAGLGAAAIGAALGFATSSDGTETGGNKIDPSWGLAFGVAGVAAEEIYEKIKGADNATYLPMADIMIMAGGGFTGLCCAVLLAKAIFGEGGAAEILKGIGSIVPG